MIGGVITAKEVVDEQITVWIVLRRAISHVRVPNCVSLRVDGIAITTSTIGTIVTYLRKWKDSLLSERLRLVDYLGRLLKLPDFAHLERIRTK